MRYSIPAALVFAAAATAVAAPPFTLTVLVREGDSAGSGNITTVDNVMVNNNGDWLVECDTNHPVTDDDGVLIRNGVVLYTERMPLQPPVPTGQTLDGFDDLVLNNNGDSGWNWFIDDSPTLATDSGLFFNDLLLIQESTATTAAGYSGPALYTGWFGAKMNDSNQLLTVASIDDPGLTGTANRAIMRVDYNAAANTFTETVLSKAGELVNGRTITDFSTDPFTFSFNNAGTSMYCAEVTGTPAGDAIVVGSTIVAQEGFPSSVDASRNWELLNDRPLDLNNSGAWVMRANLAGDTANDELIVKSDGSIVAREGQTSPDGGFLTAAFGTGPVLIDDAGNVLWYADSDNPDTFSDNFLMWNGDILMQEGVTQIGGETVTVIRGVTDGYAMSENGKHIMVRVVLGVSTDAAVLITFSGCGTSDFNGDGDFGTDADIEAFFACLGGTCCATCFEGGSDFNNDGDFGTDQDIESFFRVLGGGNC